MPILGNSPSKIAYSISEVITLTGLGRTKLYAEINEGHLPARKLGRRTLILASDLEEYLKGLNTFSPKKREVSHV